MKELVKDQKLIIQHIPGKGAWTYHIVLPGTKHIRGKAGKIRVSGTIDSYEITNGCLTLVTNGDKLLPINQRIRTTLNKAGGDEVLVTMYLLADDYVITAQEILDCFNDAGLLTAFQTLPQPEQHDIIADIQAQPDSPSQEKEILHQLEKLSQQNVRGRYKGQDQ